MSHLMLPILIGSTKYCLTDNGKKTTQGVATTAPELVDLDSSPWILQTLDIGETGATSAISFGVSCATQVLLYFEAFEFVASDYVVNITVSVNGVEYGTIEMLQDDPISIEDWPVDLSNLPCGNVITISCTTSRTDPLLDPLYVYTRIDGIS